MSAYVYYSYEEWGRGYIGARSRSPGGDDYLGSFSDPTFTPTEKIILGEFETMEEALEAECALHEFYDIGRNPHFANRARQTSKKFTTSGVPQTEEWTRKAMANIRNSEPQRIENTIKTNRERKTNCFFNPTLRRRVLEASAKKRKEMAENKETLKWGYLKEKRKGWSKELWEDIEKGLSSGLRFWGKKDIAKKHKVSPSTMSRITAHIKNGVVWEDLG